MLYYGRQWVKPLRVTNYDTHIYPKLLITPAPVVNTSPCAKSKDQGRHSTAIVDETSYGGDDEDEAT
jgi:hypothetical protein